MTEPGAPRPPTDSWVASVHAGEHDPTPLGSAVVIDRRRALTCAHVILDDDGAERSGHLWVSFPRADLAEDERRSVVSVDLTPGAMADIAVLVMDQDVPLGVEAAPLRQPRASDVVGKRWWAFGFPDEDPIGDCADGHVGAALAWGWVRLDTSSRYLVRRGFSGGGLWSPDYDAVVGLVGQAHPNGDGRAVTLFRAEQTLPAQKLGLLTTWSVRAAGEVALAAWGWSLAADPEGARHWRPRARGVSVDSERGYRFRGRGRALTEITGWLDRPVPDRRVLVVTGSPGLGKSAVLGRVVTTADAGIADLLPDSDDGVRARVGSVACAVHAKAKTALEVAVEIARAASARLPRQPADLASAVREALEEPSTGRRFNLIIDALDEAASPEQARVAINKILLPLAETCSDVGVQVVVGTRRNDDGGSLLDQFAGAQATIDLDDPRYFATEDLAAYALACLQLTGDERPGNPYNDDKVALPFARRIANLSDRNFLVAGLVARGHGMHDVSAMDPGQLTFGATVDAALREYLDRISAVVGLSATQVLTGLAFAEAPGLPAELWQLALESIYGFSTQATELVRFARSSAANFLVESGTDHGVTQVFRLFHQALNDALVRNRAQVAARNDDERALTSAFVSYGQRGGWEEVPEYLLRSLPGHAAAAGMIDDLLTDDNYLLHADLRRVLLAAGHATSAKARRGVQLIGLTPEAVPAGSNKRAAMFSVTQALEDMEPSYLNHPSPYLAMWARARPRRARAVLEGHHGAVRAVCAVEVTGRRLLASAGDDGRVCLWDPTNGERLAVLESHRGPVYGVSAVEVAGRRQLAIASSGGRVRFWDPASGEKQAVSQGHRGWIRGVCEVEAGGRRLIATASSDRTVRLWDPQSGKRRVLKGSRGGLNAVCVMDTNEPQSLASAGDDGTVRLWDPVTGERRAVLEGHQGPVYGVCAVDVAGQQLLASASDDGTVRLWDPQAGEQQTVRAGARGGVNGVCAVEVAGQQLLVTAGQDGSVRMWDPETGGQRTVLRGLQDEVIGVCAVEVAGLQLLVSASKDRSVRLWDLQSGKRTVLEGHRGAVWGVCAVEVAGRPLVASAGSDRSVRLWDPQSGTQRSVLEGHRSAVRGVCAVEVAGRQLLASADEDGTLRVWDPASGKQRSVLEGHQGAVLGMCAVSVSERQVLATASQDRSVRLWDPVSGVCTLTIPVHHPALAVAPIGGGLAVGLDAGILMIDLRIAA